jgi:hypothetical protein
VKKLIQAVAGLMVAGLMAAAPAANAVTFTITGATFNPANGYGTDKNELDVTFGTSGYWNSAQTFALTTVGQTSSLFNIGLVNLRETDIAQSETGNLGVTATFAFTSPFSSSTPLTLQGTGVAVPGAVDDCFFCFSSQGVDPTDYTLSWAPMTLNFGAGGQVRLDMTTLSFNETESHVQTARLTLVALPSTGGGGTAVPEPTTIALLGLGLLGFAASRKSLKK